VCRQLTDNNEIVTDIVISVLTDSFTQFTVKAFFTLTSFNLINDLKNTATDKNTTSITHTS